MLILHIFRKDLRQQWPILLGIYGAVALLLYGIPQNWFGVPSFGAISPLKELLFSFVVPMMLLMLWVALVAFGVQEDPLYGDTRFWITRPYEWPQLFAAKLLMLLLAFNLPLLLLPTLLILRAGLWSTASIGPLLQQQVLWTALTMVPGWALLSLNRSTSTRKRDVAGFATLVPFFIMIGGTRNDLLQVPLIIAAIAVIAFAYAGYFLYTQFSGKSTARTRTVFLFVYLLTVAFAFFTPHFVRDWAPYAWTLQPSSSRIHIPQPTFDPLDSIQELPGQTIRNPREALVQIPLRMGNIPPGFEAAVVANRPTIHFADGTTWTSLAVSAWLYIWTRQTQAHWGWRSRLPHGQNAF